MISTAIFPCKFTDGARVLGELSYTLNKPVYTDQMVLSAISTDLGAGVKELEFKLFSKTHKLERRSLDKEELIDSIRQYLEMLMLAVEDWIYYGFFSSLLHSEGRCIQKILIFAEEECRVQWAIRQERVTEAVARELIKEHDMKASNWTQFLFSTEPYATHLYDTVVRYECQDLLDSIAYIFMLPENMQQAGTAQYQLKQDFLI